MASSGPLIDGRSPRALFSDWVGEALAETDPPPSPWTAAYLVDLLAERLRTDAAAAEAESTLAEAWLRAREAAGALRARGLRAVGDRALFVAGFFGESLTRKVVGVAYYRDIGSAAYGDLSVQLGRPSGGGAGPAGSGGGGGQGWEGGWHALYAELAERFGDCLEVLGAVADRARTGRMGDVLFLYDRWLATGSPRVARRLADLGCVVGPERRARLQ
jgi:hypothetical protein